MELREKDGEPLLIVPGIIGESRFHGRDALEVLVRLLARASWTSLGDADVAEAVDLVDVAERRAVPSVGRRRKKKVVIPRAPPRVTEAWRQLAGRARSGHVLSQLDVVGQLALEMAVREELERLDLAGEASAARGEWTDADEVGRISDDLLLPERIWTWLRERTRGR